MTSKVKVNTVETESGSTLTLGKSGDTVTLASGASQSGFGRTGTVNWDTTKKTASFTAVSGNGYFIDTSSSAITITLPASPSAGDIVGIKDYAISFATNNCTMGRNSSNINGAATDPVLNTNGQSVFLVYVDATKGWIPTQDDTSDIGALYVAATGGTVTTCGDYKIHTFTSPGTFCVSAAGNSIGSNSVDYMVIAGGGGGGPANNPGAAGGGGAGGYRESSGTASGSYTIGLPSQNCAVSALPVSVSPYPITVGGGGAANTQDQIQFLVQLHLQVVEKVLVGLLQMEMMEVLVVVLQKEVQLLVVLVTLLLLVHLKVILVAIIQVNLVHLVQVQVQVEAVQVMQVEV